MTLVPFLLLAGVLSWAAGAERPNPRAIGSPDAPIAIDVFSDFECPACKALHEQTLPLLLRDYVAPGKVYLVHHEFPLPQHRYARLAAAYACAAARIGRYQEVGNRLFEYQNAWAASGKVDEAACSGLTPAEAKSVRALVNSPGVAAEIQSDIVLGHKAGLNQTPTMIVRHGSAVYPVSGAVNYDLFRRFLDDQLSK